MINVTDYESVSSICALFCILNFGLEVLRFIAGGNVRMIWIAEVEEILDFYDTEGQYPAFYIQ